MQKRNHSQESKVQNQKTKTKAIPFSHSTLNHYSFDSSLNEVLLFSQPNPYFLEIIFQSGFEEKWTDHGLLGSGLCFYEDVMKFQNDFKPDKEGEDLSLLVSRVFLGNSHISYNLFNEGLFTTELKEKLKSMEFDSVVLESKKTCRDRIDLFLQEFREFVIPEKQQSYCEFLIEYRVHPK